MEFFSLNKFPEHEFFKEPLERGYKLLLLANETNLYTTAMLGCVTSLIDHDHLKIYSSLWLTKFHKYFDRNPQLSRLLTGIATSINISTIKSSLDLKKLMIEIKSIAFEEVNDYNKEVNIKALIALSQELNAKFYIYPRGGSEILLSEYRFRCPAEVAIMEYPYKEQKTHFLLFKEGNLHECTLPLSIEERNSEIYMELIELLIEISKKQTNVREIMRNASKILAKYENLGLSCFENLKSLINLDILNLCTPKKRGKKTKKLIMKKVDKIVLDVSKGHRKNKAEENRMSLESESTEKLSGPPPILNLVELLAQNKTKIEDFDSSSDIKSSCSSRFNQGTDKTTVDSENLSMNPIKKLDDLQIIQSAKEKIQSDLSNEKESNLYNKNSSPKSIFGKTISVFSKDFQEGSGIGKSKDPMNYSNNRKRGLTPGNTPSKSKITDVPTSKFSFKKSTVKNNQSPITTSPPLLVLPQAINTKKSLKLSNLPDLPKHISENSSNLISNPENQANLPLDSELNSISNPTGNLLDFPQAKSNEPQYPLNPEIFKEPHLNSSRDHEDKLQPPQLLVNQNPLLITQTEVMENPPKPLMKKPELIPSSSENLMEMPSALDQIQPINKFPQFPIITQNSSSIPTQPTSNFSLNPPQLLPGPNQILFPSKPSLNIPEISQEIPLQPSMNPPPFPLNPPQLSFQKTELSLNSGLVPVNQPQLLPNAPAFSFPPPLFTSNPPKLYSKQSEPPSIPSLVPDNQIHPNPMSAPSSIPSLVPINQIHPNPMSAPPSIPSLVPINQIHPNPMSAPPLSSLPQFPPNPQLFSNNPPQIPFQPPPFILNPDISSNNPPSPLASSPYIVPKLPFVSKQPEFSSYPMNPPQLIPVNPVKPDDHLPAFIATPPVFPMNPLPFQANPVELVSRPPPPLADLPVLPPSSQPFFTDHQNSTPSLTVSQNNPPKLLTEPPVPQVDAGGVSFNTSPFISTPPKLISGLPPSINPLQPKPLADPSRNPIQESQILANKPKLSMIPPGFIKESQEKVLIPEPAKDASSHILNMPSVSPSPINSLISAANPDSSSSINPSQIFNPESLIPSQFQKPPVINADLNPTPQQYPKPPEIINRPYSLSEKNQVPVPWLDPQPKLLEHPTYLPKDSALTSSNVINIRPLDPVIQQSVKPEILLKDPLGFLPSRPLIPNTLVQPSIDPGFEYPYDVPSQPHYEEEILAQGLGYMNPMERFQQSYCEDCLAFGSGIDIHLPCQCINCFACIQFAMVALECSKCLRKYSQSDLSYLSVYVS